MTLSSSSTSNLLAATSRAPSTVTLSPSFPVLRSPSSVLRRAPEPSLTASVVFDSMSRIGSCFILEDNIRYSPSLSATQAAQKPSPTCLPLPDPMPVAEVHKDHPDERETQSPSPDLSKLDFYNPLRKPRGNNVPNIVIPSAEIYGSETPSPLSPITPPDRLSPIEELDDNASLRSTKAPNPPAFDTSAHHDSPKPPSRPKSNEFDFGAPAESRSSDHVSLEKRSELLFSRQHLEMIFADMELSIRFGTFLRTFRPDSVPVLGYYLETIKALRTLKYAEAVVKGLEHIPGLEFTADAKGVTMTWVLEDKADRALDILVQNDLPAFIAYAFVCVVDLALVERVTGKANLDSSDVAIGLAEVFTISDPSKPDNPLVFASDEFHRMTQYPSSEALGRNCRFLGGPKTDSNAIGRFKASLQGESEHCEVMLNYRRDGSPFINLIMVVPLRDQNGKVRYYLGAQLDITELVNNSVGLPSLQKLVVRQLENPERVNMDGVKPHTDLMTEFQQLSETFNPQELQTLLKSQQRQQMDDQVNHGYDDLKGHQAPHVRHKNSLSNLDSSIGLQGFGSAPSLGFYQNYLLVRPHPSLRILFASQDLRVPGILQSPLMDQIGGSPRVRDDLYHALEAGQKVTAKVQWLPRSSNDGRARWIHCTPLISANGLIGVWMVILVDDNDKPHVSNKETELETMPTATKSSDTPEPTTWDRVKVELTRPNDDRGSPSTTHSGQTAVSDSAKSVPEKLPPVVKELPEDVPPPFVAPRPVYEKPPPIAKDLPEDVILPFLTNISSGSIIGVNGPRSGATYDPENYIDKEGSVRSTGSHRRSRQHSQRFGPFPEAQVVSVRPGPRIAGKAYSFHSEHGISPDDERDSINSRGDDRPTSRDSNFSVAQSSVQPSDIKWRRPNDHQGADVPGRGGRAAIKSPGRPSQDLGPRPPAWKTKKSLSPYGFLFNE